MWHSCDNISGNKLQQKVIEIADAINVKIEPSEIEACHRLPKGDTNFCGGNASQDTCLIFLFLAKAPQKLRTKDK